MRIYSPDQEEKVSLRADARTWRSSGLITGDQLATIETQCDPALRQTNLFFRVLLLVFTVVCLFAVLGFVAWLMDIRHQHAVAAYMLIACVPVYVAAEYLVKQYALYRHGIEEAFAVASVVLLGIGSGLFLDILHLPAAEARIALSLLVASCLYWLYARFGFHYTALAGLVSLSVIPFQLQIPETGQRALLFGILFVILLINIRNTRKPAYQFVDKFQALLQGSLFLGMYFAVNLRLADIVTAISAAPMFRTRLHDYAAIPWYAYWGSYALVILLPAAALLYGFKYRKRAFIDTGLITAVLTLSLNKDYLGLKHYAWDPALLGILLIVAAVISARWLAKANGRARNGYTADNLLKVENHGLELAQAGVAAAIPSLQPSPDPAPGQSFSGGQSGGGGATRNF